MLSPRFVRGALVALLSSAPALAAAPSPASLALAAGDFHQALALPALDAEEQAYIEARTALAEGRLEHATTCLAKLPGESRRAVELSWLLAHASREPQRIASAAQKLCKAGDMTGRSCVDVELYSENPARQRVDLTGASCELPMSPNAPVPVVVGRAGGVQTGIVIDTGASQTVVSSALAKRLGMKTSRGSFPVGVAAGGASVDARLAVLGELVLGTAVTRDVPVLVLDLPELEAKGVSIILSPHQALDGLAVTFDFQKNALRLARAEAAAAAHDVIEVPYLLVGFDLAVKARVGARQAALFGLDTGMSHGYAIADWYAEDLDKKDDVVVQGAGEKARAAAVSGALPVEIGDRKLGAGHNGIVTPMRRADGIQFAGLLGNALWSKGSLTLDTANRRVLIRGAQDTP